LSSVTSSEYRLDGHIKRIKFLQYLDDKIDFDLFGKSNDFKLRNYKGSLPYLNKDDGIFPYKYTIACENILADGYFTEKIIDAILGECLCFYWGCPDIDKYINPRCFIRINLDNHVEALNTIINAMNNNEWEKRVGFIKAEKFKILNELQLLPTIERIIFDNINSQNNYINNDLINIVNSIPENFCYYYESEKVANSIYNYMISSNKGVTCHKNNIDVKKSNKEKALFYISFDQLAEIKSSVIKFKKYWVILDNYDDFSFETYRQIKKVFFNNHIYSHKISDGFRWIIVTNCEVDNLESYRLPENIKIKSLSKKSIEKFQITSDIKKMFTGPSNFIGKKSQLKHNYDPKLLANALNHINSWKEFINGKDNILIVLDNVHIKIKDNFDFCLTKLLNSVKNDNNWDILYLDLECDTIDVKYYIDNAIAILPNDVKIYGKQVFAYCITKKAAEKLVKTIETIGIEQPIEQFFEDQLDNMVVYKNIYKKLF